MNVFFNLFLFYMKLMVKSYFYIGTMLFMTVMLVSRFLINWNEEFNYMEYGSFAGEMTIIVQALFLLFMVFFYKRFSDEVRYNKKFSKYTIITNTGFWIKKPQLRSK